MPNVCEFEDGHGDDAMPVRVEVTNAWCGVREATRESVQLLDRGDHLRSSRYEAHTRRDARITHGTLVAALVMPTVDPDLGDVHNVQQWPVCVTEGFDDELRR